MSYDTRTVFSCAQKLTRSKLRLQCGTKKKTENVMKRTKYKKRVVQE